jgi:hypothetical protein
MSGSKLIENCYHCRHYDPIHEYCHIHHKQTKYTYICINYESRKQNE